MNVDILSMSDQLKNIQFKNIQFSLVFKFISFQFVIFLIRERLYQPQFPKSPNIFWRSKAIRLFQLIPDRFL
jgi:hypothetical protein